MHFFVFAFYREFATRLFSFLRFTIASHEIRTALWQALLPPGAIAQPTVIPTGNSSASAKKSEPKLNFEQLGRRFELNAGSIRAAIASAVAEAAMREGQDKSGMLFSLLFTPGEAFNAYFPCPSVLFLQ